MSRNKRKGLRAGYRKAGPTLRFTIKFSIVALILGVFYFLYDWQFAATKEGQKEARIQREEIHREEMEYIKEIPKLRGSLLQLKTVFRDRDNNKINVVPEIEIIESKIISAQRGYIKIRVATQFLNAVYDDFVSLSYEYERYQPVMLTFVNDTLWGAGVIFSSPEYRNTATVYLNQCFRFKGGGRMTYTEDLVFQLYYNDFCIYLVTNSGAVEFEHSLPPLRYGLNTCIAYFDNDNTDKNSTASKELPRIKAFFENL